MFPSLLGLTIGLLTASWLSTLTSPRLPAQWLADWRLQVLYCLMVGACLYGYLRRVRCPRSEARGQAKGQKKSQSFSQARPFGKYGASQMVFGLLTAFLIALPPFTLASNQVRSLQLSLSCHKTQAELLLRLEDVGLAAAGKRKLTLLNLTDQPCLKKGALVYFKTDLELIHDWQTGDVLKLSGQLRAPRANLQLAGFDVHAWWFSQGTSALFTPDLPLQTQGTEGQPLSPSHLLNELRRQTSEHMMEVLQSHPQTGTAVAMVTGDQGLLTSDERALYAATGVAHLIAISGLHITLFAMIVGWAVSHLIRKTGLSTRVSPLLAGAITGLLAATVYAVFTGWAPPAQRTVWMLSLLAASKLAGLRLSIWNVWLVAVCLCLILEPLIFMDAGFLFSFGAVAVLIFAHQGRTSLHITSLETVRLGTRSQLAVTLGLFPVCLSLFSQQSWISPLTNALAIPWMTFVSTPLLLAGGLLGIDWMLWLGADSLAASHSLLDSVHRAVDGRVFIASPQAWQIVCSLLGALILLLPLPWLGRSVGLILWLTPLYPAHTLPDGAFEVTFHDVGQGTAVTVRTRSHSLQFDAGSAWSPDSDSGLRVIAPFLHGLGVRHLDALWISHADSDHAGGALSVIETFKPARVAAGNPTDEGLIKLLTQNNPEVPLLENCHNAQPWVWDGVEFKPLVNHPSAHNEGRNNSSCVLKISNGEYSVLLTGDIEATAENRLVRAYGSGLASHVLQTPHHGSNTSSSALMLASVSPQFSVVQSGWGNRFNHPHKEVLTRHHLQNSVIMNTAQTGAVQFVFSKGKPLYSVRTAANVRQRIWHLHSNSAPP